VLHNRWAEWGGENDLRSPICAGARGRRTFH
jgi:hypothetical protein